jgi:hypothetical protein
MRCVCLLLFTATLTSCAAPAARNPWTSLKFNTHPDQFQFAVVGDRTGKHRPGVFEKGIDKLNLLQPEFVVSVGDLIEGYTRDEAEIDQQWDEVEGFISKLQMPFFHLPGNHDLSNEVQAAEWHERFGKTNYHFVYRDVLFLIVNTSDPAQRLSPEQIAEHAKALKENANVRWTCVFMHEPLWTYDKDTGWDQIEKLLADRKYTVFAGHTHTYTKYIRNDRRYIVLATMGGAHKGPLKGAEFGMFDHIAWVTMMPDGPRLANIELDAIHDEDVLVEAQAELIKRVTSGNVLQVIPGLASKPMFESGPIGLSIRNDANVPLRASGKVPANGVLHVEPDSFDVTVQPGKSAEVLMRLRTDQPTPVNELPRLKLQWTARYDSPGFKPLQVPNETVLAVAGVSPCPARTSAVVVDGNLDEWSELPHGSAATNAWDCSYQFGVAHDENYIYVAVRTTDDTSVLNALKEPWSQDGVEIRFDGRDTGVSANGRGRGEFKDILVISMSPGESGDKMVLYNRELLPKGVKAVCVKTSAGHSAEVAIPVSYLNERQNGAWKAFRMNVAVDDFDKVAGPLKALWWQPDWRSAETFAGSGTFERK